MNTETNKSLSRIIHQTITHCQRQRLVDYDHVAITPEFVNEVGAELVDLFERRIAEFEKKTPPTKVGASSGWFGGKSPRQRGRY